MIRIPTQSHSAAVTAAESAPDQALRRRHRNSSAANIGTVWRRPRHRLSIWTMDGGRPNLCQWRPKQSELVLRATRLLSVETVAGIVCKPARKHKSESTEISIWKVTIKCWSMLCHTGTMQLQCLHALLCVRRWNSDNSVSVMWAGQTMITEVLSV